MLKTESTFGVSNSVPQIKLAIFPNFSHFIIASSEMSTPIKVAFGYNIKEKHLLVHNKIKNRP